MKRSVVKTDDGSSSIYIEQMDEHYHSTHGAIQEANHVFIENGLLRNKKEKLKIFELGFGTGLNAFLTYVNKKGREIEYDSIEAFPVEIALIEELNYVEEVGPEFDADFKRIHEAEWGAKSEISDKFQLNKFHSKIQDLVMKEIHYDMIFFDAFGPRAQSEMWDIKVLEKMYKGLIPGGELITYCAQGQFKRDLKSLGFEVIPLPGPPGKREMTVGVKR